VLAFQTYGRNKIKTGKHQNEKRKNRGRENLVKSRPQAYTTPNPTKISKKNSVSSQKPTSKQSKREEKKNMTLKQINHSKIFSIGTKVSKKREREREGIRRSLTIKVKSLTEKDKKRLILFKKIKFRGKKSYYPLLAQMSFLQNLCTTKPIDS